MGLPSGLLWASANVGADNPSGYGLYFSWGNTVGYAEGNEYDFSQEAYNQSPAASISADLSLDQDAARSILGAPWRMPTDMEFEELYNNCTIKWATFRGVQGALFTSNINGNWLFFPSSGRWISQSRVDVGSASCCWSSTYVSTSNARGSYMGESSNIPRWSSNRRIGLTIRAVYDAAT